MKLTVLLIALIASINPFTAYNQEKKYQSLLWEISGNGLQKNSYMYGTMHVSEKISYHLSDSFFNSILNVDFVATESDPATWDNIANIYYNPMDFNSRKFYSTFYNFPIVKDDLAPLFYGMNYNQTHLLSRTDDRNRNYQEDTYLDMFIYRTGRKYGKNCVGLEDAKESLISIQQGRTDARSVDHTFDEQALNRLQKNKNTQTLMEEYYREKDLDMLDSLVRLTSHPKVLEGLLYNRNRIMVRSMDSLMHAGSLFAAVGASHLPGKDGMIEMLREMGYTVKPVFSDYTDEGRNMKKTIDAFFLKPNLTLFKSNDGMIEIPLFDHFSENNERIESTDIVNGGYINVKRILVNDFLRKDNNKFNHLTLDSMFFENIPGDILEKKYYQENGVSIYDIKSITKTKKAEHYRYYITPLEIIAVIMGGEGNYVRQFEEHVFNRIKIKKNSDELNYYTPKRGGFEVHLPGYCKVSGDNNWNETYSDVELYAFDSTKNSYYFLIERTLTDVYDLYDSKFELERIAYEFLFQFDAQPVNETFNKEELSYRTTSRIGDNKEIELLTTMKGSKYYLLATINAGEIASDKYFSSFKFKDLIAETELVRFKDKKGCFSVEIPKKYNEFLDLELEGKHKEWSAKNKFNIFEGEGNNYTFYNPTGEKVEASYFIYGEYESFKDRESFWKELKQNLTSTDEVDQDTTLVDQNDFERKRRNWDYNISRWTLDLEELHKDEGDFKLINEKLTEPDEKGVQTLTGLIVLEESTQAIRIKVIITENTFYYIQALVEKSNPEGSKFINHCFSSFEVYPKLSGNSIFQDKMDRFINEVNSDVDSIRYSALLSANLLSVNENNMETLQTFLDTYEFQPEDLFVELSLASKILEFDEGSGIEYFERLYKSDRVLPSTQLAILEQLATSEDRKMYQKIQELMEHDLPLAEFNRDIDGLFYTFRENKNSEILFPDILQYYGIPEYNNALIDLTEYAVSNHIITARKLKSYRKMLLTNAKLEYKRLSAWKQEEDLKEKNTYGSIYYDFKSSPPIEKLLKYLHILNVFKKDKDIAELLAKVDHLNLNEYYLDQIKTQMKNNKPIDDQLVEKLMANTETQFSMFQAMHHKGRFADLKIYKEDAIAKSAVLQLNDLQIEKDSLTFIEKIDHTYRNLKLRYFYYKITDIDENSEDIEAEKIAGIAFVVGENGINPQSYFKFRMKQFIDQDEISDYIKESIDQSIYQKIERASHNKFNRDNYNEYYYEDDYYEDEEYYEGEY